MKLYYAPGACSLAPHIVAHEVGVTLTPVKVDLKTHKTADGADFRKINPRGYVPALDIADGDVLTEASVTIQYLADLKPASGIMAAAGSRKRLDQQQWLAFIATEVHKSLGSLFAPGLPPEVRTAIIARLQPRFQEIDARLGKHPFLMGDTFSAPDAYAFTVLNWTGMVKVDLAAYPNIQAFQKRVAQRPAVQAAMKAEGLL